MSSYKLMALRIKKQCRQIQQKPLENILVAIKSDREIHFCIYGLDGVFKEGYYHGVLQLPQNYPFSAPKFKMMTGSDRFQVGKYVCTTFTSYHQEAWSSSWTIRTILTAILSFFLSEQTGYGTIQQTDSKRMALAKVSLDRNLQDEQFLKLFGQKLKEMGVKNPIMNRQQEGVREVNMIEMNSSVNDQIVMQQNIESVMLPEAENGVRLRNNNHQNCAIKMLYAALILVVGVIIFV